MRPVVVFVGSVVGGERYELLVANALASSHNCRSERPNLSLMRSASIGRVLRASSLCVVSISLPSDVR